MIMGLGQLTSAYGSYQAMPTGIRSVNQGGHQMIRTISQIQQVSQQFEINIQLNQPENNICVFQDGTIKISMENTYLQIFIQMIAQIILQFGIEGSTGAQNNRINGEVYQVMQVNLIALIYVIIGIDWLITVVSWEQFNQSQYQQVSMQKPVGSKEISLSASVKYFQQSAYTTSFLLLSITFLYGLTGTTSYDGLIIIKEAGEMTQWPFYQMMLTFLFKLGAAPQHNWAPDQYDSLPTYITLWMITIPKTTVLFLQSQQNFVITDSIGSNMLLIFGTISLQVGSIGLSNQWKIKRFQAYSSISNLGFILQTTQTLSSYYFYIMIYVITTLIIFSIILSITPSRGFSPEFITDFSGLYKVNPGLAYALAICQFSQAGCPPQIGFFAKQQVIVNLLDLGYYMILIILIISSVISACNYLSIIQITHLGNYSSKESVYASETLPISYRNAIFISAGIGILLILLMIMSNLLGDLFNATGLI